MSAGVPLRREETVCPLKLDERVRGTVGDATYRGSLTEIGMPPGKESDTTGLLSPEEASAPRCQRDPFLHVSQGLIMSSAQPGCRLSFS